MRVDELPPLVPVFPRHVVEGCGASGVLAAQQVLPVVENVRDQFEVRLRAPACIVQRRAAVVIYLVEARAVFVHEADHLEAGSAAGHVHDGLGVLVARSHGLAAVSEVFYRR